LGRDFEQFRNELDRLRPQVDNPDVLRLIESLIAQLELQNQETAKKLDRFAASLRELDQRVLTVENSRVFRILQKVSHVVRAWKSRTVPEARKAESKARAYQLWLQREEHSTPSEQWFRDAAQKLQYRPTISILVHVSNPRREWLESTILSVIGQTYPEWELCVSDDASLEPWVGDYLEGVNDPRIHFVRSEQVMGPSSSLNRAAILSSGHYFATLDQHALLCSSALFYAAETLQERRYDLLYADHDQLANDGRRERPCFKPGWSRDLLECTMYIGRFLVLSKDAFARAGGFRAEFDGAHLYDLALRLSESGSTVAHIPQVAVSERPAENSPDQDQRALGASLERQNCVATVERVGNGAVRVHRKVIGNPLVTLIVCSRNANLLDRCLRSIDRNTTYSRREILVVHHCYDAANDGAINGVLDRAQCTSVQYGGDFNFAAMNNRGAESANGEILVFLNDDVRPLAARWLEALVVQAQRAEVGIAGAQLLYPSGLIQHASIAIGMMDGTGHPGRNSTGDGFWNWNSHARNVTAVTGACLAIRREVFAQLDGFDCGFPSNYNDVDLCLRAREAGFEVIYEPAARLEHEECATRPPGVRWQERERFQDRWGRLLEKGDPYYSRHLARNREDCSLRDG